MPRLPFSCHTRHTRRTAWIVVSLGLYALLIAAVAVIVLWVLVRVLVPPTPPPDRVAAIEKLVAQFDQLVFGGHPGTRAAKWIRPIRIVVYAEDAGHWRPVVEKHATTLAELTGLEVTILSEKNWRGNFFIHFVKDDSMYELLQDYDQKTNSDELKKYAERMGGVAFQMPRRAKKNSQFVAIVSTDDFRAYVSSTVLHELVHGVGLHYHSKEIQPTIMSDDYEIFELSVNDKIALRTLYDDRIKPGMWRDEALPVAREIIAELVEEARAQEAATPD